MMPDTDDDPYEILAWYLPDEILAWYLPGLRDISTCPDSEEECSLLIRGSGHNLVGRVGSLIVHLNDDHKWRREQIADWLDSLDLDLSFRVGE